MVDDLINEMLIELDRHCLLHNIDSDNLKQIFYHNANKIIQYYEQNHRRLVLRREDEEELF